MKKLQIGLGVILIALIGVRLWMKNQSKDAAPSYGKVSEFKLTNQEGQPFGSSDLKGQYWIADFIFTRCMGPCPVLSVKMTSLQIEFKDKPNLRFVSFSVDPEHDTPAVLKKYAENYGSNLKTWNFLTGSKADVYKVIRESFKLVVEEAGTATPDFIHSLHFVLVDPNGNIVGYYNTNEEGAVDRLRAEIKAKV